VSEFRPYRPQVPFGLPEGHPVPVPRRPQVLSLLGWMAGVTLLIGCALVSILVITTETGVLGLATGIVLAAVPVYPVISTFLWLDRYEAEPRVLLVFTFAWGAGVATLGALIVNSASTRMLEVAGGDASIASVVVAPVVEESLKGMAVLAVLLLRRHEFDGIVDGIVYAGLSGVGFAFVENVLYLGRTLAESGGAGTVFVFVMRCVVSPFAHPLFTAAIGIGLGVAVRSRLPVVRIIAPVLGLAVAVLLHGVWNLSAVSGLSGFVSAYVAVQLPVLFAFIALAVVARSREGRLISRHLQVYGSSGWLAPGEVSMLASLPARRDARQWAGRVGGLDARRAMRDFQEIGSELAFLRERMVRGTAPADARTQEYAMLAAMSRLRERFVPTFT
jgi:RsiW-degrading membrane proteinase PrsW (M82 family)